MARYMYDRGRRFISVGAAILASSPDPNANTTPANSGAAATTGAGDELAQGADCYTFRLANLVTWDVRPGGTGSYTSYTVNLEASLDGVIWDVVDSSTLTTGESRTVQNVAYRYYRGNVSAAVVSSGAPTITVGITLI